MKMAVMFPMSTRLTWLAAFLLFPGAPGARSSPEENQLARIKRVYVEAFPEKTGSKKLREDLIAQLQKQGMFSIVATEGEADAVIAGDGETWIKGYQSLNPRSGRLPSNGQPLYAGFLSIEVKDAKGETLWSYLVTLGPESEGITKELSKQIVRHLTDAMK